MGAGASYAEGKRAGLPKGDVPPLMRDFIKTLWLQPELRNPGPVVEAFLRDRKIPHGRDGVTALSAVEDDLRFNIEQLFAFAYEHRHDPMPSGWPAGMISQYENLLFRGIIDPLSELLIRGLLKDFEESRLPLAEEVAACLQSNDVVVNLNYDTIFEVGARNAGHALSFEPARTPATLRIAKPHGSINMFATATDFSFSPTLVNYAIQPVGGATNFQAVVPPRFGKSYEQHPVARTILAAVEAASPTELIFWGTSIPASDLDLLDFYRRWAGLAAHVSFINPSDVDYRNAVALLGVEVTHHRDSAEWAATKR